MADMNQIARLRVMIAEPDTTTYSDTALNTIIDQKVSLNLAAATIWREKASAVAHLVDISEGGSSRKTSDLHKNYLAIARQYDDDYAAETPIVVVDTSRPRTRAIRRA